MDARAGIPIVPAPKPIKMSALRVAERRGTVSPALECGGPK